MRFNAHCFLLDLAPTWYTFDESFFLVVKISFRSRINKDIA